MNEKNDSIGQHVLLDRNDSKNEIQGYPIYPSSEDIYSNAQEEEDVNPEDPSGAQKSSEEVSGNDLDIPGSELDDEQEMIGSVTTTA